MKKTAITGKKNPRAAKSSSGLRQIAAGEFKAKVLRLIDEVNETGGMVVITKRGEAKAALVANPASTRTSLLGRLQRKYAIHGDLFEPVFLLGDYDMLK